MPTTLGTFYDAYQAALDEGVGAVFVGAGLSKQAGYVDWKGLLRGIAAELDLDVDSETDLVALAQYHVNHTGGRGGINQALITEFTRGATLTRNHHLLASLPVSRVWTTNYDQLLEQAFKEAGKIVDKKVAPADLARTTPRRDVVLIKMHGDIDSAHDAVLVKEDYERYDELRRLFSEGLKGDLVSNTFLFLGFSFTDPNVGYLLGRVRSLMGENKRPHYWITRDVSAAGTPSVFEVRRQQHRIADLKRYGIQTVLIQEFSEIEAVLGELNRRVMRRNVLLSGSADEHQPLGDDRSRALARRLGSTIIEEGFNVVCGMGRALGDAMAMGAVEAVYRRPLERMENRVVLRPFPQIPEDEAGQQTLWKRYREDLVSRAGAAVFLLGNKKAEGGVVVAGGVLEEFTLATKRGAFPLPVGISGHAAEQLWREVRTDLPKYFGGAAELVRPHFDVLNDAAATDDDLVQAIVAILKTVIPR